MALRWFKLSLEGAIAVGNLVLVGMVLVCLHLFPVTYWKSGPPDGAQGGLFVGLEVMAAILTFPVGWLALVLGPTRSPLLPAIAFVPLNAYLWGYASAALVRRRRSKETPEDPLSDRCESRGGDTSR